MIIEQTIEVPESRRITFEVPPQIPVGRAILTLAPVSTNEDNEHAYRIWFINHTRPEDLKEKLQNLKGSLGSNAFSGLDGVTYQHKVREEWND